MFIVALFILWLYYWFLYSFDDKPLENPLPNRKEELEAAAHAKFNNSFFTFTADDDDDENTVSIRTDRQEWTFALDSNYYYRDYRINTKDNCFGKANNSNVVAGGKLLHDYIRREQLLSENEGGSFRTDIDESILKGRTFFFRCMHDKIADLRACLPGSQFMDGDCIPVDRCNDRESGDTYADPSDKHYYYTCTNGRSRRTECPKGTLFYQDACRPLPHMVKICQDTDTDNSVHPVNNRMFIRCRSGKPNLEKCRKGTFFSRVSNQCELNLCVNLSDGSHPLPEVKNGEFMYLPGSVTCKDNRVDEISTCPSTWDVSTEKENLTHLPMVYDTHLKRCSVPSFCTNVWSASAATIVPAHDFTKHVMNWDRSELFDAAIGYRCLEDGKKKRIVLKPGQHVNKKFRIGTACTDDNNNNNKVVIGDTVDRYYDCGTKSEIPCPEGTFFDGKECSPIIENAHRHKHVGLFRLENISPYNDWIIPWKHAVQKEKVKCEADSVYVPGFNMCADPDCVPYPFLKQIPISINLPDGYHSCIYRSGKIVKKRNLSRKRLKFWSQRFLSERDNDSCKFGQRVNTGYFVIDSVLYATCNMKQPFVFCPSASTQGIVHVDEDTYACLPKMVREKEEQQQKSLLCPSMGILPANVTATLFSNELDRILPQPGARYSINGINFVFDDNDLPIYINYDPTRVSNTSSVTTLWSDREMKLFYKSLVTYPPNVYWRKGKMHSLNLNYTMINNLSTNVTLNFNNHDVEQSAPGFAKLLTDA